MLSFTEFQDDRPVYLHAQTQDKYIITLVTIHIQLHEKLLLKEDRREKKKACATFSSPAQYVVISLDEPYLPLYKVNVFQGRFL